MLAEQAPEAAANINTDKGAHAAQETSGTAVQSDTAQAAHTAAAENDPAQTAQTVAAATIAVHAGAPRQHEGETNSPVTTTKLSSIGPPPAEATTSSALDPATAAARLEARRAAVERRKWLKSMLPLMHQRIAELEVQAAVLAKKKKRKKQHSFEDEVVCSLGTKHEFSALLCPSSINDVEFSGSLLDSGATLSCISSSILPRLQLTPDLLMEWSRGRVKGAGGTSLNILGSLIANISVGGGSPVLVNFIVVEHLSHDVIIGLDCLTAMGASLTFKDSRRIPGLFFAFYCQPRRERRRVGRDTESKISGRRARHQLCIACLELS